MSEEKRNLDYVGIDENEVAWIKSHGGKFEVSEADYRFLRFAKYYLYRLRDMAMRDFAVAMGERELYHDPIADDKFVEYGIIYNGIKRYWDNGMITGDIKRKIFEQLDRKESE